MKLNREPIINFLKAILAYPVVWIATAIHLLAVLGLCLFAAFMAPFMAIEWIYKFSKDFVEKRKERRK